MAKQAKKTEKTTKAKKPSQPRTSEDDPSLQMVNPRSAGVDVHAREHWVCVPSASATARPTDHPAHLPANVRPFGTRTGDLERLADWLADGGIETVAMESTGIYEIPLFDVLERRGFKAILVNPGQTRPVAGRPKSDVQDCPWIQRLHSDGLLSASFRPDDETCVLRSYLRQRQTLIADAGRAVQHMQKALEPMNVKRTEVVSDITGVTGMFILRAILRGTRDAEEWAKYRHAQCKATAAEIAAALRGTWREEHVFTLKQAVKAYEHLGKQRKTCDVCIEKFLQEREDQRDGRELPADKSRSTKQTEPSFDVRSLLFRWSGMDLTKIEGIGGATAMTVLSEMGLDMSLWPSEKHFASWLGLCPQHRGSGNKITRRRIRGGANRAALAFRMAAQGCHHAKNAMGAYDRRIQSRAGGWKAVTATAHQIACRVYRMLKYGEEYVRQEMAAYEAMFRIKQTKSWAKKAAEMGYKRIPTTDGPLPAS